jgi:signal transduction histidine kinase
VVNGDRGKCKQVLLNLLTNAIKYNRENGQVFVETTLVTQAQDLFARVAVRDTGYGISRENQKHMFQKFFRADNTSSFTQGTGIGLTVAKHIIEAHKGQIGLESEEDVGTTFYFTLPIHVAQ